MTYARMKTLNATSRPAQQTTTTQVVYVFDQAGNLLGEYESITSCAEKLALKRPCISAALQRGSIAASRYYISYKKIFKASDFNQTHNPLAGRSHHPHGDRKKAGFLERDFFEVLD